MKYYHMGTVRIRYHQALRCLEAEDISTKQKLLCKRIGLHSSEMCMWTNGFWVHGLIRTEDLDPPTAENSSLTEVNVECHTVLCDLNKIMPTGLLTNESNYNDDPTDIWFGINDMLVDCKEE